VFENQLNYWTKMNEMLLDNYKTSLKAGQDFQESFAGMLKEIMEANVKNTVDMQKELEIVTKRNGELSFENIQKFNKLCHDNMEKGIEIMRSLFEKYNVTNNEFRKEIETLWKDNYEKLEETITEINTTIKSNHEKNVDLIFDILKKSTKEMEKVGQKMEKMAKSR